MYFKEKLTYFSYPFNYIKNVDLDQIVYFIINKVKIFFYNYVFRKKDPRIYSGIFKLTKWHFFKKKLESDGIKFYPINGIENLKLILIQNNYLSKNLINSGNEILKGTLVLENDVEISIDNLGNWSSNSKSNTYSLSTFTSFAKILSNNFLISGDKKFIILLNDLINSWSTNTFIGQKNKWNSTITSIRLENLLYVYNILKRSRSNSKNIINEDLLANLIINHVKYIENNLEVEHSNNHLIFNLVAILLFHLSFENDSRIVKYSERYWKLLVKQLDMQVLNDGGWAELSPYYHMVMSYWLACLFVLAESRNSSYSSYLLTKLEKMKEWFDKIIRPDFEIPLINDSYSKSEFCNTKDILILLDSILNGGNNVKIEDSDISMKIIHLLSYEKICSYFSQYKPIKEKVTTLLSNSGRCCFRYNGKDEIDFYAVFDCGNLGYIKNPSHAHADALSFELMLNRKSIFVDPGVSGYGEGPIRNYFRGTRSHNTIIVDNKDQSILHGSTRFKSFAKVKVHEFYSDEKKDYIVASHDGYKYLDDPVNHKRSFLVDKLNNEIKIIDFLSAKLKHKIKILFHLAPKCLLNKCDNGIIQISNDEVHIELLYNSALSVKVFEGSIKPFLGWYASKESELLPIKTIELSIDNIGDFENNITIKFKKN